MAKHARRALSMPPVPSDIWRADGTFPSFSIQLCLSTALTANQSGRMAEVPLDLSLIFDDLWNSSRRMSPAAAAKLTSVATSKQAILLTLLNASYGRCAACAEVAGVCATCSSARV